MKTYDVVVVGAGPAGSTAARYAALGGARVLVLERKRQVGAPVQCGEFLPTAGEMQRMFPRVSDLDDLFDGAQRFVRQRTRLLRIFSPARYSRAPAEPDASCPASRRYDIPFDGLVLDRELFDRSLAEAAVAAGAELWKETKATALKGEVLETTRGPVRARVVIGADGPRSVIARDAGLAPPKHMALGVQYLTRGVACDPGVVEMHFGRVASGGYAWVIPKGEGLANVGLGVRPGKGGQASFAGTARRPPRAPPGAVDLPGGGAAGSAQSGPAPLSPLRRVLDDFLSMLERRTGRGAEHVRFTAGLIPVGGPRRRTVIGSVMLAGDAAGHLMPCNGGGIPTAMIAGRIAGEVAAAHVRDGLALLTYEHRWRRAIGRELAHAVTTRRIFDVVTRSRAATELAMLLAGPRGMRELMTCRPWYRAGL